MRRAVRSGPRYAATAATPGEGSTAAASQVNQQLRLMYPDGAILIAEEICGKSFAHSQSSSMRCIQYSGHSALHSKKVTLSPGKRSKTPPATRATSAWVQF